MVSRDGGPPVLGIDLGGTKIVAGIVDAEHTILGRAKRSTPAQEGETAILQAVVACALDALADAGVDVEDVAAIGVGSPGPLDSATGMIHFSVNLNVRNFPLGPDLQAHFHRPVLLENDVRVGGYGEYRLGAGRGYRHLLAAFIGTGIGGCLILDGQVVTGLTGNAGEVGHMIVKAGGPRCGCGARGCLESLSSKTAIARRIGKALRKGLPSILSAKLQSKSSRLKSRDLAAAVAAGDPVANKEVNRAAYYLGLSLGSLINLLGPEIVIVGGGVTEALGEPWIELVRTSARGQALTDPKGQVLIERAALGDNAGILGAALLARERYVHP
jgi:glucokinase